MLVLHDPTTLDHETVELLGARLIPAYESPKRIKTLLQGLKDSPHDVEVVNWKASPTSLGRKDLENLIRETHRSDYVEHLSSVHAEWVTRGIINDDESVLPECFPFPLSRQGQLVASQIPEDLYARAGYYAFDMSSGITSKTYDSILTSANLAVEATKRVLQSSGPLSTVPNSPTTVLALCRPPGHHCDGHRAGGYCYVNNAAVSVSTFRQLALHGHKSKIAIIDLDFHHGNGTQEIFYTDPLVFYASIHGKHEFPYYTGSADEKGDDPATGYNLNFPLPKQTDITGYINTLNQLFHGINQANFRPEFLIISLGFDTYKDDPIGSFEIDTPDYETMARTVRRNFRNVPMAVILLEGGYVVDKLAPNLLSFLRGWEDDNNEKGFGQ